ncbi:hypothetical protein GOP47_0022191 [Adiantum capillus-veneris]|uniref:Uncharacterized protein n=1 Tax=Adiantum capillus-veneris TaxID=13818 RepID=A0A9D4UAJ6_ADICA|nr:hypothetical protein GOP47_0022191 [Adiantum capillus-veneris]
MMTVRVPDYAFSWPHGKGMVQHTIPSRESCALAHNIHPDLNHKSIYRITKNLARSLRSFIHIVAIWIESVSQKDKTTYFLYVLILEKSCLPSSGCLFMGPLP